jgi:NAD(P)H-dependent FMN reductase
MKVLALCGSLRRASINRMLLQAMVRLAPEGMEIEIFDGLRALPMFDPDLEVEMPESVRTLREAMAASDALLIASPEYAHGLSSVLKTALDWMVSDERFYEKPIGIVTPSPSSTHAAAQLREVLTTMSGRIVEEACVSVQVRGTGMDVAAILADPTVSRVLMGALRSLADVGADFSPRSVLDPAPIAG